MLPDQLFSLGGSININTSRSIGIFDLLYPL